MTYTLRAHTAAITCVIICGTPEIPQLLSGDVLGTLILWNLITRRPIAYKVCNAQIISLQIIDNIYIVQYKDHTLRFFRLQGSNEIVKIGSINRSLEKFDQIFEIPVNTLNFANVIIRRVTTDIYQLWCCNTQDSEAIDIYEFSLHDPRSLKRLFESVRLHSIASKLTTPSQLKFEKLGILMKFIEHDGIIYCGFESGFVIGLTIISECICMVYISSIHYPDPILQLSYNDDLDKIMSTSTTNVVAFHKAILNPTEDYQIQDDIKFASSLNPTNTYVHLHSEKISFIENIGNYLVTSNWSGKIELILNNEKIIQFEKPKSLIPVDMDYIHKFNKTSNSVHNTLTKIGAMTCFKAQKFSPSKSSHSLPRRVLDFINHDWCCIGYEDGTISLNILPT